MQDSIIAGSGNSRYLKSVSNFMSLYPTYADFVAALVAGTLPVDLNGINAAGWTQIGTALAKGNLLSDTTAALINVLTGSTPGTVTQALSYITGKTQALSNAHTLIETGFYAGTGTYGSTHKNSITFSFTPKLVIIFSQPATSGSSSSQSSIFPFLWGQSLALSDYGGSDRYPMVLSYSDNTVQWYNQASAPDQFNVSPSSTIASYLYIAFGYEV